MRITTLFAVSFVALHMLATSPSTEADDAGMRSATSAPVTTDWMAGHQDALLGDLTLQASHDTGMSTPPGLEMTHCRGGAFYNITLTQSSDMAGQLARGVRVFDVRPILYEGSLYTAHGTKEAIGAVGLQLNAGCRGQSIDSLLSQLREFLDNHPTEIVIVNTGNIDYHAGMFSDATGPEVARAYKSAVESRLGELLLRPQHFTAATLKRDVWNMRVGDLADQNRRVIMVMECQYTEISRGFLGCLPGTPGPQDVYLANTTGPWANSPHATTVASVVTTGWRQHVDNNRKTGFGMSWTATMDTNCTVGAFSWKLFGVPPSRLPAFMARWLTRAGIELDGHDHCRSIKTMNDPLHALLLPTLEMLKAEGYLCPDRRPRIVSLDFVDSLTGATVVGLNDRERYTPVSACESGH